MSQNERRNLILLTVDAWRADFADTFEGMPLLPALDEVASRIVRFRNCYANAPWTTPALISCLSGESPAKHGVHYQWSAPRENMPSIAKHLAAAGYVLPNVCYLNSINGYQNMGFGPCPVPDVAHAANDRTLLNAIKQHRDEQDPFFLWYHYKFLHLPYWPGEPYRLRLGIDERDVPQRLRRSVCTEWVVPRDRHRFPPSDVDLIRRLYAAEILELNDFLQPIVEELLTAGLLERTTFVLTADHGDEHLEHGHIGHASTSEHATLYEEVLRVPLIVIDSRIDGAYSIDTRIQGMDLHSTLLSLAGHAASGGTGAFDFSDAILHPDGPLPDANRMFYFHGSRMGFRTPPARAGQIVEGISDGKMKFIAERYDTPRFELYDLVRDPRECEPQSFSEDSDDKNYRAAMALLDRTKVGLAGA